jgi:hypothetical protein
VQSVFLFNPDSSQADMTYQAVFCAASEDGDSSLVTIQIPVVMSLYTCGDANGSGTVNILDVTFMINYLYRDGPAPDPPEAADVNGSGNINLLDITYLISYLYKGGPDPVCM